MLILDFPKVQTYSRILDLQKVQISKSKQQQFLQFLDLFGSPDQVNVLWTFLGPKFDLMLRLQ